MIQVGKHKPGSNKPYSYSDVRFDSDGWADVKKYLPISFDLMLLKDEKNRTIVGWYAGGSWDGARYNGQEIKLWKREKDGETENRE